MNWLNNLPHVDKKTKKNARRPNYNEQSFLMTWNLCVTVINFCDIFRLPPSPLAAYDRLTIAIKYFKHMFNMSLYGRMYA
jgi:hypothetical protein